MIKLISQNGEIANGINEYVVDNKDELNKIKYCDMGSTAFIIETQETYVLNGKREWVLKKVNIINSNPDEDNRYQNPNYWNEFWDAFQDHGEKRDYSYNFSNKYGINWTQELFKPKYDIVVVDGRGMFLDSEIIDLTSLNINLDFSKCTSFQNMFYNCKNLQKIGTIDMSRAQNYLHGIFENCQNLQSIEKIILPIEQNDEYPNDFFQAAFYCPILTDISFEGQILANFYLNGCPSLSRESLLNVIKALALLSNSYKTLTLLNNYHKNKLTDEEIKIAQNKGWTVTFV